MSVRMTLCAVVLSSLLAGCAEDGAATRRCSALDCACERADVLAAKETVDRLRGAGFDTREAEEDLQEARHLLGRCKLRQLGIL